MNDHQIVIKPFYPKFQTQSTEKLQENPILWIWGKTYLLWNHSNSPSNMSEVDSELHF